jgi:NADH-quinone oxidoreductase subunit B
VAEARVTDLDMPAVGPPPVAPSRYAVSGLELTVHGVGLACCAVEFDAAVAGQPDLERLDPSGREPQSPGPVPVLVVAGTVTDKLAPTVRRMYDELPEPRYVISFGSCANSGGPYWDSYCVTKGVDQIVPVDVYVPGCPPRPEALLDGLRRLRSLMAGSGS